MAWREGAGFLRGCCTTARRSAARPAGGRQARYRAGRPGIVVDQGRHRPSRILGEDVRRAGRRHPSTSQRRGGQRAARCAGSGGCRPSGRRAARAHDRRLAPRRMAGGGHRVRRRAGRGCGSRRRCGRLMRSSVRHRRRPRRPRPALVRPVPARGSAASAAQAGEKAGFSRAGAGIGGARLGAHGAAWRGLAGAQRFGRPSRPPVTGGIDAGATARGMSRATAAGAAAARLRGAVLQACARR